MKILAVAGGVLLALLLITGVTLGGWEAGWWFKTQNTNRNTHLYQHSYGAQTADEDAFQQDLQSIKAIEVQALTPGTTADERSALNAQRLAVINQACTVGKRIYQPPADVSAFLEVNCQ